MDNKNPSFDMSYIEKMSAGDKGAQKQLLEILLNELQNDLPRASKLVANEDWENLARFCHHFKSTIAFTGNKNLINANLQLWDIAKKGNGSVVKANKLLSTMNQYAKRIEREVKDLLKKM